MSRSAFGFGYNYKYAVRDISDVSCLMGTFWANRLSASFGVIGP